MVTTHVVSFREALSPFPEPDDAVGGDLDLLQRVVRILHLVARAPSEIPGGNGNGRGNGNDRGNINDGGNSSGNDRDNGNDIEVICNSNASGTRYGSGNGR